MGLEPKPAANQRHTLVSKSRQVADVNQNDAVVVNRLTFYMLACSVQIT